MLLRLTIIEAQNLPAADCFSKKSDPYTKVTINKEIHQTKIQKRTLDPKWHEELRFMIDPHNLPSILFEIYDWDRFKTDDFLGHASLALKQPIKGDLWLNLSVQGKLHINLDTLKTPIQCLYTQFTPGLDGIALKALSQKPNLTESQEFKPSSFMTNFNIEKFEKSEISRHVQTPFSQET
ncbi:synaptotagmin, putative [Entamoeba invadens IP1]|uniref:Synaptotagmin, putative n=1 Tax=Entamoeba invadens IP1 TaxID=370355 RepID=L7FN02_ENTIV|nr:synaptotagmin, putative [Entamoeba invadens IP1]ELP90183.1 synaptotagmin, putative [Entamoeba invadens IP1]|eukprot:XP_004256954.1 synaptotagmin, putative [Entamoeba invadens IP1]